MKNILTYLLIFITCSACSQYEEGPFLSLKTRKARLAGSWLMETGSFLRGLDPDVKELLFVFEKDGDFRWTYVYEEDSFAYTGRWKWLDDQEGLCVKIFIDGETYEFDILKLSNKHMKLIDRYDGAEVEFRKQ